MAMSIFCDFVINAFWFYFFLKTMDFFFERNRELNTLKIKLDAMEKAQKREAEEAEEAEEEEEEEVIRIVRRRR